MALNRTAEEEIPDTYPRLAQSREPEDDFRFPTPSPAQLVAAFQAISSAVGARITLLLAGAAAFALAWRVLESPDPAPNALWALGIFSVVVFGSTVLLNARRAT